MNEPPNGLKFTGERFTLECEREIWYEHWHRYVFARELVRGKRVLDAACGEGYGSALLADVAVEVVGVDIDRQTIEHARGRYPNRPNLRFERGDCTRLDLPRESVDVVVCFETLEHVHAQQALIDGFASALKDDGILIVSSPDRYAYSEARNFQNEFHVRELYRQELLDLLKTRFAHVRLLGQKLLFQSAIWSLDGHTEQVRVHTRSQRDGRVQDGPGYQPLYFIAVCSRQPLTLHLPDMSLFGDAEESVYEHYNGEVRRNIGAGHRIQELESEVTALKRDLSIAAAAGAPGRQSVWRRLRNWLAR